MDSEPERVLPEEQDFDPDGFDRSDAALALAEGIELFNSQKYHAAHEAIERCWLANEGADADFYKGLIQAAICLHHLQDDNVEGARKLYQGHRKLLAAFLPSHAAVDVAGLLSGMQLFLRPIMRDASAAVDWSGAPRISSP